MRSILELGGFSAVLGVSAELGGESNVTVLTLATSTEDTGSFDRSSCASALVIFVFIFILMLFFDVCVLKNLNSSSDDIRGPAESSLNTTELGPSRENIHLLLFLLVFVVSVSQRRGRHLFISLSIHLTWTNMSSTHTKRSLSCRREYAHAPARKLIHMCKFTMLTTNAPTNALISTIPSTQNALVHPLVFACNALSLISWAVS